MNFRLSDITVMWSGVDSQTPEGCSLASGTDPMGNTRLWLFHGDEPSDETYLGSVLMRSSDKDRSASAIAYDDRGTFFAGTGSVSEMLQRLADRRR